MFKVIQQRDRVGELMDEFIVRTVYAVDRATEEFLIVDSFGDFRWIPMWLCVPYNKG